MPDIAAYRLRAFEAGFIVPRLKIVQQSLNQDESAISWTRADGRDSKLSHVLIQLCLLREAAEWVREGRSLGYFSSLIDPLPIVLNGKDVSRLDELEFFMQGPTENTAHELPQSLADKAALAFDIRLHNAIEDLTDDRIEFLRLIIFTNENEWQHSLEMLRSFNDEMESKISLHNRAPGGAPSTFLHTSSQVDALSWAFSGAESYLPPSKLPSDWRSDPEIRARISDSRLSDLMEERGRLRRLVETLSSFEEQPSISDAQSQQIRQSTGTADRATHRVNDDSRRTTKGPRNPSPGLRQKRSNSQSAPDFSPGDIVDVYVRMAPQANSRIKKFRGFVLERMGEGIRETFTVRKVSFGVGVERTFPINSEVIEKIEVVELGQNTLRAKYYLRHSLGRAGLSKQKSQNKIPPR